MNNDGVSPQGVIEDLADQNRRLSIDCAVLRTAVKQLQAEIVELGKPLEENNQMLSDPYPTFKDSEESSDTSDET